MADKGEGQNGDGVRRLEAKDTDGQQKNTAQQVQQATQGNTCLIPDTAVDTAHLNVWQWNCREINPRQTIQEKADPQNVNMFFLSPQG